MEEEEEVEEFEEKEEKEEEEKKEEKEEKEEKKDEKKQTKKEPTRDEFVYLSKLYERAERYPDMVSAINKFIEMNPKLSKDERNILSAGYKNILSDKKASWRLLNSMERKETKKKSKQVPHIKEIKKHVEDEMKIIFEDLHKIIDTYLLPNAEDMESKVFYLRLKGDHYRYLCEITKDKEFEKNIEKTEKVYNEAFEIAEKKLPVINSTRVGLCLNMAVFYYEVKGDKKKGCQIAKKAFEESMKYLDDLEKFKTKDVLLLIQLLKENFIFWSSEMNDEEPN
jgi:14-3-3 protein epsilon